MVKKAAEFLLKSVLKNPVFTAAFICAVLFYSGMIKLKDRHKFVCFFDFTSIQCLEGCIASSPVKSLAASNQYSADFQVNTVHTLNGQTGQCKGRIKVLIPGELVEQCYPGKLYSLSAKKSDTNSSMLFEQGAFFIFEGGFLESENSNQQFFKVNKAKALGFTDSLGGNLNRFRGLCRLLFKRLMYSWGKAGGLLLALLSGSKEYTEQQVSEGFRNAGLSHILALSGMHLSLFGGIAFFFGSRITRRNTADLLELMAILFFVWFAGLSPSLFRALISAFILYINSSLRMNRFKGLTVLSATFLLHLMIFPYHLNSPAFKLSYGALAGIMTVGQVVKHVIGKKIFPFLAGAVSESAGAQIFTAPITYSIFGKLMPIGIISSVIVSPMIIFFLYLGLAGTVLCLLLPFLSGLFNGIMNCIYSTIKFIVLFFAKVPPVG